MMNVLMQLRKVCNHPDLFEPRPIKSPFISKDTVVYHSHVLFIRALEKAPLESLSPDLLNLWQFERDEISRDELLSRRVSKAAFLSVDDMSLPLPLSRNLPHLSSTDSIKEGFTAFVTGLNLHHKQRHAAQMLFNYRISERRCSAKTMSLNWRTVQVELPITLNRS